MFANSTAMGINFSFPDICMTPPAPGVPVPYLNMSYAAAATGDSHSVLWMLTPAHKLTTKIPTSVGDEAGSFPPFGIISHMIKGPTYFLTGAFTVLVNGLPATRMTSLTLQNKYNMLGMSIVPCQFRVLLLSG